MAVIMTGGALVLMGGLLALTAGNGKCHCTNIFYVGLPMLAAGIVLIFAGVRRRGRVT